MRDSDSLSAPPTDPADLQQHYRQVRARLRSGEFGSDDERTLSFRETREQRERLVQLQNEQRERVEHARFTALREQANKTVALGRAKACELRHASIAEFSCVDVKRTVAAHYCITVAQLEAHDRTPPLPQYRQIAIYLAVKKLRMSLLHVGYHFDRDHTTISYAVRRVEDHPVWKVQAEAIIERMLNGEPDATQAEND